MAVVTQQDARVLVCLCCITATDQTSCPYRCHTLKVEAFLASMSMLLQNSQKEDNAGRQGLLLWNRKVEDTGVVTTDVNALCWCYYV